MKKRMLALALVMLMLLSVTAVAVMPRAPHVVPRLSFNGTTATCKVNASGDSSSDRITVLMVLWHDGDVVDSWQDSGTFSLSLTEYAPVIRGETYVLTADVAINGIWLDTVSVDGTC